MMLRVPELEVQLVMLSANAQTDAEHALLDIASEIPRLEAHARHLAETPEADPRFIEYRSAGQATLLATQLLRQTIEARFRSLFE